MPSISIVRSDDLRHENRRRVLNVLRAKGPSSPASLASETGLSAASISSLTTQLAEQGVVQSTRRQKPGSTITRGRPQSLIALDGSAGDIITLNLAIDLIQVSRINYAGKILSTQTNVLSTRDMSDTVLLDFIRNAIQKLIDYEPDQTVCCIGVGLQGVIENASGTLMWSPIIQQRNIPLGAILRDTFKLPVTVNNDCRLISEALSQTHHELLGKSFATVLFSHGVGLGLYVDGQPFSGVHSSALEMGHLRFERSGALCRCGKGGCIEAYAADYGILRLASGASIDDDPLGRVEATQISELCEAATNKDRAAIQAFAIAGAAIGEGLATLFTLFDPMPVALVGRSKCGVELMQAGMNSVFREQPGNTVTIDNMLHCFDDAEPLLTNGLTLNTLAKADRLFAYS